MDEGEPIMTEILFDFWELLVENVFGSVGMAILGVAIALSLILFITRTSKIFIIFWMGFYFTVMVTLYIGALGLVIAFIGAAIYSVHAIIRYAFREV